METIVKDFFRACMGQECREIIALPPSGSARKNFIIKTENQDFILTQNSNIAENEAFFYFSQTFSDLGLNTPYIYGVSADRQLYLQSFLGKETLSEIIQREGESERVRDLVRKTLKNLHELQVKTQGKIDFSQTFEYEKYDEIPILHDLFYFKFMFVDVLEVPYHKSRLIKEFFSLVKIVENLSPKGLMLRDFQSRNIMVNNDEVFFIDYQSAMQGALMYDVVSFLYQAKANFSATFKAEMLAYYYGLWQDENIVSHLKKSLQPLLLIRALQVLGAYGFRGLVQRKSHFLQSIKQGVENATTISNNWNEMQNFPELKKIIGEIQYSEYFKQF